MNLDIIISKYVVLTVTTTGVNLGVSLKVNGLLSL